MNPVLEGFRGGDVVGSTRHKDHDERVYGVRPDLVLDATDDDANWIKRKPDEPPED